MQWFSTQFVLLIVSYVFGQWWPHHHRKPLSLGRNIWYPTCRERKTTEPDQIRPTAGRWLPQPTTDLVSPSVRFGSWASDVCLADKGCFGRFLPTLGALEKAPWILAVRAVVQSIKTCYRWDEVSFTGGIWNFCTKDTWDWKTNQVATLVFNTCCLVVNFEMLASLILLN